MPNIKKRNIKIKEKGFDRTSKFMSNVLCINHVKRLFKSFDNVQSWVGGIGKRTGLKSQRREQRLAGSKFLTKFPYPAHLI